ncbi:hypothetical protein [Roseivirga sp. UBA1976]|uniref:hypothetical protein n=1 Tax=Roseivirga sp. UBA1976 TaxID=1947386 RepID=UPI00257F9E47|nr:hypothetical protein [Roseivirga sp. UBA1976]MEC7754447.1 hypothetical protein [Bacteroidota bacterium]
MHKSILWSILLSCLLVQSLAGQSSEPADSVVLTPNVKTIVEAADVSIFPQEYHFFIENYQNNGFSAVSKNNLLHALLALDKKRVRIRYDIKELLDGLRLAREERSFSSEAMEKLSYSIRKAAENYDRIQLDYYIKTLYTFLKDQAIYKDRYQAVFFRNAEYEIAFNEDNYSDNLIIVQQPEEPVDIETLKAQARGEYIEPKKEVADPFTKEMPEIYREMGSVIHLKRGDIVLASQTDTFTIERTEGYFLFDQKLFRGQDGYIDWTAFGVAKEAMQVRLGSYEFPVNAHDFKFENVWFNQPAKIDEPISGELTLNLRPARSERGTYPRFISYNAGTPIKGLGSEKLTFKGGVNYQGMNFYSKTAYNEPSTLIGRVNGEVRFKAISKDFVFNNKDSLVSAVQANITLYHAQDSIFHPAIEFVYDYKRDRLVSKTSVPGYKTTPFRSSFYNMDLTGDQLSWDLNSDSLNIFINSARADVPLSIESKDFYSADRFHDLAQIYSFHPLIAAVNMAKKNGGVFYTSQMARQYGVDEGLVKKTMELLMSRGLVRFDEVLGEVEVLAKGYHYLEASRQKTDYDDLIISSVIANAPNATFNFKDSVLTVRGVEKFLVSDSLDVIITPTQGEIKVLKNRDIEFDGALDAGNFQFNGENFTFRYDSFLVNLVKIDSIKLRVEMDAGKKDVLSNQLVKTSGILRINDPGNKSALKSMPQYPIFSSSESASVIFDKSDVLKGAYDSTVYFDVPPFELDSVADADPSQYAFQGTFYSNNILPQFKENLKVMPDKSFGFIHAIPDSGYNLYQTGGRLYGEVHLNKQGITSPGVIEFLTGRFDNEKATMFLDSLVAEKGIKGEMQAGFIDTVSYPAMNIEAYSMNWLAKKDSMILKNLQKDKPFNIFDNQARLRGSLLLRKTGLFGSGELELSGSVLTSDSIAFTINDFEAKNSDFTLKADNSAKPILSSKQVRINFDVENQMATIEPEVAGAAALEFPYAQFKTSIPSAVWDVNNKLVTMSKPEDSPIEQSFFYSTNTRLDSLAFNATDAVYNIETKELDISGIPYIKVADALITPEGSKLTVLENSKIEKLQNAVILMDTAGAYHRLYDAEIEILSRTSFKGRGTYELVNAVQDTFAIQFNDFQFIPKDKEHGPHTRSSGHVSAEEGIRISPGFIYEGKVTMYAYKKALELDGAVKLDLEKLKERNIWIEYSSNDDIEEVIIPFDEATTRLGQPLNAGIHFDQGQPYMSFITEKRNRLDDDFFVPRGGVLYYDANSGSFRIDNPKKKEDPSYNFAGSMFSYNEEQQSVTFEGKLKFLSGNNMANVQAAGKGKGNLDSAKFQVDAMFTMGFGLPLEAQAAMAGNLKEMGEKLGVPKAHEDRSELIYKVAEFIGDEATRTWDRSYQTIPTPLVAASGGVLNKDLVISNVHLEWSQQNKAFYSKGKISLSNVSNVDLNMELDGYMEIRKTPEGDIMNLLLEMTDGTWYYFMYDGFVLEAFSSNDAFNALIPNINAGKAKVGNFRAIPSTKERVIQWVIDYKKLYFGVDEPYQLLMASESSQTLKKKGTVEGDGFEE